MDGNNREPGTIQKACNLICRAPSSQYSCGRDPFGERHALCNESRRITDGQNAGGLRRTELTESVSANDVGLKSSRPKERVQCHLRGEQEYLRFTPRELFLRGR